MKEVIDVMQLQNQRQKMEMSPRLNYKLSQGHFVATRFIFECGVKLEAQPLTVATACVLYHRYFQETDSKEYDVYLIASTCLYLGGKLEGQPLKLRDVINVANCTLHRSQEPLDLGDEYWSVRDGIVQAELLALRMLGFQLNVTHPHKYLLHYLKSLENWISPDVWRSAPIARASWAFLQDFHHDAAILNYKPQHIALAVINLSLQCYGMSIPYTTENTGTPWYSVFSEDLTRDTLWEIMDKIMDAYEKESDVYPDLVYQAN